MGDRDKACADSPPTWCASGCTAVAAASQLAHYSDGAERRHLELVAVQVPSQAVALRAAAFDPVPETRLVRNLGFRWARYR